MTIRTLVLVHDEAQPCPYLEQQEARLPLHWPGGPVTGDQLDQLMDAGFRRSGAFLYRTACPNCSQCQPTRVIVERFAWTRSFRRVLRRGDQRLRMEISPPSIDPQRIALLNTHRDTRNLAATDKPLDEQDYRSFLIESCCDTLELSFWLQDRLVAVAITDFGDQTLSAVYCFFDPAHAKLSPGTYAILKQIEFARTTHRPYVYLGMYVAQNRHLNYKARFTPQHRLVGSQWMPYPSPDSVPTAQADPPECD